MLEHGEELFAQLPYLAQLDQLAGPTECLLEALVVEWLDEVVERGELERAQSLLVECGHENRGRHRPGADLPHDVEARLAGHLYVEEDEIRFFRSDRLDGGDTVVRGADDFDPRLARQQVDDSLARQELVIDDKDANRRVSHGPRQAIDTTADVRRSARV